MVERVNAYQHGVNVWYKTNRPRFSQHRCGTLNILMSLRKRPLSLTFHHCLSMNATLEWDKMPKRLALIVNFRKTYCHVLRKMDIMPFRLWPSRNIPTMDPLDTMYHHS